MLLEYKTYVNDELPRDLLKEIAELKNQSWRYTIESQIKWIKEHYFENDLHILGLKDDRIVAYAGLVLRECSIENEDMDFIGLGNVCVRSEERGNGYGFGIVREANRIIKESNRIGLLLCHDHLVPFYQRCDWHTLQPQMVFLEGTIFTNRVMYYNGDLRGVQKLCLSENF